MNIYEISQHLKIAELAIAHHKAKLVTAWAKHEYHMAWKRFETDDPNYGEEDCHYWVEKKISQGHPEFEAACEATKAQYEIYKAQKRSEYNIKRRLENAIRNAHA